VQPETYLIKQQNRKRNMYVRRGKGWRGVNPKKRLVTMQKRKGTVAESTRFRSVLRIRKPPGRINKKGGEQKGLAMGKTHRLGEEKKNDGSTAGKYQE